MKPLNCVIIEDNEVDRTLLEEYLSQYSYLKRTGSFSNPLESLEHVKRGDTDLLFIDIDMPVINGIEFLRSLQNPPQCIFVTGHPEFAVDAFDIQAIDYVLKPIKPDRLERAIHRSLELMEIKSKALQYNLQ